MVTMSVSRAEVISSLQGEERERQWHYTQLELISQKIRNIPLTSAQSVSTVPLLLLQGEYFDEYLLHNIQIQNY